MNRAKEPGYELFIKGALLRFLALLIAQGKNLPPMETADSRRLKRFCNGWRTIMAKRCISPMQHSWCLAARAILCGGSGR